MAARRLAASGCSRILLSVGRQPAPLAETLRGIVIIGGPEILVRVQEFGIRWDALEVLIHGIGFDLCTIHLIVFVVKVRLLIIEPTRWFAFPLIVFVVPKVPDVEDGGVHAVARSNTPAALEDNLPHTDNASKKVAHLRTIPDVPHLQCAVRAAQDLELVVLEARNSAVVRREGMTELPTIWVPYAERRVCSSGNKVGRGKPKQADKGSVSGKDVVARPRAQVPDTDRSIH